MNRFSTVDMSYVPGVQTLDVRIARRLRANEPTASPKRTEWPFDPEARIFFDVHNERLFAQSKADDIEVVSDSKTTSHIQLFQVTTVN